MSEASGVEVILARARAQEREYDWLGATESYKSALGLVPEQNFSAKGDIYERLGYAFHRAAMQAESVDDFRDRMFQAVGSYEKAKEAYEGLGKPGKTPRTLHCDLSLIHI